MVTLSSNGIVGDRRPGFALIQLDEDAFPGTYFCGLNHCGKVSRFYLCEASCATRIVEHVAVLHHVGDAIFELSKNVVAVVDTQAVAGAQVLVNPHTHDSARYR